MVCRLEGILNLLGMESKKTILTLAAIPFICLMAGCPFLGDCKHDFVYDGEIIADKDLLKDSLLIRFDNLGAIIFDMKTRQLSDTAYVDSNGLYTVKGDFFSACASDEDIFGKKDSLSFELAKGSQVITRGKFGILSLYRKFRRKDYRTTFNVPDIHAK
jgi:hypothetical protein